MESKAAYAVLIIRRGGNENLNVLETENFDEAHALWKELTDKWVSCLKETMPFVLEKPLVTAFDPGTVVEIQVVPFLPKKSTNNNPYANKMREEGFTETFRKTAASGGDLLDSGYKAN